MKRHTLRLEDVVDFYDHMRIPVSSIEREKMQGEFPYYGAQGIIDHVNDYIFDGEYVLIAEDGANLVTRNEPIARIVRGRFWVNNHAHIVRGKAGVSTNYFVNTLINSMNLTGYVTGAAQPKLSQKNLRIVEVSLPPLADQKRICAILSAYDDLIENNRRRIQLLEQAARLLYKEWFVHLRFPGHEHVKITDGVPEGWEKVPLGNVTSIVMGNSPKGDTYNELGEGMPLVNGPVEFGDVFTNRVKWTTKPSRVCQDNDLVVCVRGSTTGRNVKSDGEYCLGRGVCGISGSEQSFVDELFRANLPALLLLTTGATFPSWSGPALKSFPVLWPSRALRELFEFHCAPMASQIRCVHEQSKRLSKARDLLLPRLMNGEIAV